MKLLNIKFKLIFLSIIPTLLSLILFSKILLDNLDERENFKLTKQHVLESSAISKVIHLMQIERGLSTSLLIKKSLNKTDEKLISTKKELDEAILSAKQIYKENQLSKNDYILNLLNQIEKDRKIINLSNQSALYVKDYYSQKIDSLLDYIVITPTIMDNKQNRNFIQASIYLSTAKEALGIIRATISEIFIKNELSDSDYATIKGSLKIYNYNINRFKNSVPGDFLKYFTDTFGNADTDNTFKIIDDVISRKNSTNFNIEPDYWFKQATQTIDLLNNTEDALFKNVINAIDDKLNFIFYKLVFMTIFSILGILALVVAISTISRKILTSTSKLSENYSDSLLLLEQYKSSVDRSFVVSKTDPKGIITYVNDEFCRISGYSRDELIGKPHNIIRHPDTDAKIFENMWHTIKDLKQPWFGDIKNQSKNKETFWTKAIVNPILDNDANIIEFIGIRTDITELENAKEEALSAQKTKSAFLATMSHELRTPLNAVIGFSQILMLKDDMTQENIRDFIKKINISGKHLLGLVNNILDFSKIESGKMKLNKKEILVENLIDDTISIVENEALKKKIEIVKKGFSNIDLVADEQLLKQVVLNILSNAIKFSNQDSSINISYQADKENHIISICDKGVGLSNEQLKTIFKPFSQIREHQSQAIKGTGLGLVISQKIVELHDGKIEVQSEENKGSCFSIYLPILKILKESK